jgi:hypothetical protein
MADATVRGRFVWHELFTPNPAGAQEFYGNAVGWTVEGWEHDPKYLMFAAQNGVIGAAVLSRAGTPQWVPYIGTPDVAATVEAATRLGGRVETPPTDIPGGGRYALLADPQGATFGVHASGGDSPPEAAPGQGEFTWHELATNVAPAAAFTFYNALFGWDEISQYDMGPAGAYLIFGRNGAQIGGMFDKGNAGKPGNAYWLGYVSVADLEGAIERTKAARGSVLTGPMDVPGGDRIAQLMDPHGAFFALHFSAARAAAPAAVAAKPAKAAPRKAATTPPPKAAKKTTKRSKRPAAKRAPAKKPAAKKPSKKAAAKRAKPAARNKTKRKTTAAKPKKAAKPRKPSKAKKAKTKKRRR